MKKTRKILFILTVLIMCLSVSTPVSAAVKISSKSVTLTVGKKKQLKVTGTKKKVKWSSNKKKVATVSQKGMVTAKSAGTAKITAKVGSKKYTCAVKVKKAAKISLNKTNLTLKVGQSYSLKLKNATGTVSWSTSDSGIAMALPDGTVTGMKAGSCIVAAVYGGKEYRCLVTVKQTSNNTPTTPTIPDTPTVSVTGISLNYSSLTINVGESKKITATISPSNATNKSVTWMSSNNRVATVDSVGNVKGVSSGTATITANCGGSKATCIVTVKSVTTSNMTIGQKNALEQAKSYLEVLSFSRDGLIEQLEYEKYSYQDAVYAVDHCGANWNEQALKKAKSYLETMAFSEQGLIDQLVYEKFTREQAEYGVAYCGANWFEQAAKKAASYLSLMSFSRDGLIEQLEYEKFTYEQAVYGVEQNGY